jgi:hypothetical protein
LGHLYISTSTLSHFIQFPRRRLAATNCQRFVSRASLRGNTKRQLDKKCHLSSDDLRRFASFGPTICRSRFARSSFFEATFSSIVKAQCR